MSDTFCSRGLVSFQDYLESVLPSKKVLSFRIWVSRASLFVAERSARGNAATERESKL